MKIIEGGLRGFFKRFFSFSIIGLSLTVSTIIISTLCLAILKTELYLTYFLMYTSSIVTSYLLNAKYTYKARKGFSSFLMFVMNYGVSFLLGLLLLKLFRTTLDYPNFIIGLLPIPFQFIWNFIFSHFTFTKDE